MIAYWFKIGEYIGLAIAKDKASVFWEIDQFCDPFSCEIITAKAGGFCCKVEEFGDEVEFSDLETSGHMPLLDDKRWREPEWPPFSERIHLNAGVEKEP